MKIRAYHLFPTPFPRVLILSFLVVTARVFAQEPAPAVGGGEAGVPAVQAGEPAAPVASPVLDALREARAELASGDRHRTAGSGAEKGDYALSRSPTASDPRSDVSLNTAAEEVAERARLESLPPASIPVQDASLASAISLVATAAGMNFIAPAPEEFPESVTLSTRISPWGLLQLLSQRYRFTLRFHSGVWVFDREGEHSLVSRTYQLRNTNLDSYKSSQNSFNLLGSRQSGGTEEIQSAGGLVFTPQTQKIIDDLRELVGQSASKGGAVGNAQAGLSPEEQSTRRVSLPSAGGGLGRGTGVEGRVLYLPDSNALYITATRVQHSHVEEYLRVVDRPVRQIRIEAKFFETTHDPKLVLGMDPSGYQPNISMSNLVTRIDLNRVGATRLPEKVLLGAEAMSFQIRALSTDDRTKLVNNPSVVVANNREAYFSVGDEEPFVSSNNISNGAADGGFGTTQAHVAIRRIGTTINIVPTYFEGAPGDAPRIRLSVRIEVGVLKGFRRLNNTDVPVVSSQKYEYTVFLRAGETLAFGGLSGSTETESVRKVPLAGDIPLLGHVFKSRTKQNTQRNLVAYLSATLAEEAGR